MSVVNIVTRRSRADTSQRIVEALEAVIIERGLEGVSLNYVAEKANTSKVLIYRYFGGLDGLMDHYVRMGKLFPILSPEFVLQIRPDHKLSLSRVWYRQVIQVYRSFRSSNVGAELFKATVVEKNVTADVITKAIDEELTRLVDQLSFVAGADNKAISAVILGGMSYMTILAQLNRPIIGLDLRDEADWKRIEGAVKLLYIGLSKLANTAEEVTLPDNRPIQATRHWS
jgi:AcrR family transcriptional regulator